jgi:hypothetical protein
MGSTSLHQDNSTSILSIEANTRNATNPNGASSYHLENFSELLTILGFTNNTLSKHATNGNQPSRAAIPVVVPTPWDRNGWLELVFSPER